MRDTWWAAEASPKRILRVQPQLFPKVELYRRQASPSEPWRRRALSALILPLLAVPFLTFDSAIPAYRRQAQSPFRIWRWPTFLCTTLQLQNQEQRFEPIYLTGSWTLPNLPVLLLLLHLSLLFEAFLRRFLAFLYPFAFLFHDTLLFSVFLCLGPSIHPREVVWGLLFN